jgi:Fe-S-cluster-containing hydrogenase component 2
MKTEVLRKIIRIDEEKCDGCGVCVPACVEGALQIVDGKAKLISEVYCDGLGACLGECPQGAITIEEREAGEFDEEAAKRHLTEGEHDKGELACGCPSTTVTQFERQELPCGCPSATVTEFGKKEPATVHPVRQQSMLGHWPFQLALVPPRAPFLQGSAVLLTADCVPFAYAGFHHDFLKDHALLVACPKLDDFQAHLSKLTAILLESQVKSLAVVHMEVPCCSGLVRMAQQAILASGRDIPLSEVTIGVRGELKP